MSGGRSRLLNTARAVNPDERLDRLLGAAQKKDRQILIDIVKEGGTASWPAAALTFLGNALWNAGAKEEAVTPLRRAHQKYPSDFWINQQLALDLKNSQPPRIDDALRFCTAALASESAKPKKKGFFSSLLGKDDG